MKRLGICLACILALPCLAVARDYAIRSQPVRPIQIHRSVASQLTRLLGNAPPLPTVIQWRNPQVGDAGVLSRSGVPEGLTLVDESGRPTTQLDMTRGVAVYIHGWTPPPQEMPRFLYPELWRAHGFNTFIFRWHNRSYPDLWKAEKEANTTVSQDFARQFQDLRRVLDRGNPGSYPGEIRFIGFSLGAYVALNGAYECFYRRQPYAALDWRRHRLRRVDLIEPAFIDDFLRADQVEAEGHHHTRIMTTSQISRLAVGIPRDLRAWGVVVVAFCAAVNQNIAPHVEQTVPTQTLSSSWRPTAREPNLEDQHLKMLPYYMKSIDQRAAPVDNDPAHRAFSAATPTSVLRGEPLIKLEQVSGLQSPTEKGQVFRKKEVESTRGGVLVDQEPFPHRSSDSLITFPVYQVKF